MIHSVADITKAIAELDVDPALCAALRARLEKAAPNFVAQFHQAQRQREMRPFPNPATITAAQMSLFDNWIEFGGKRPKRGEPGHYRERFKVTFDLWTKDADKLDLKRDHPAFSATSHLWTAQDILNRASGKRDNLKLPKALTVEFRAELAETATKMGEDDRLGIAYTKMGKALGYHNDVVLLTNTDFARVLVRGPNEQVFTFTDFASSTSKGDALPLNCFGHARMARNEKLAEAWKATVL